MKKFIIGLVALLAIGATGWYFVSRSNKPSYTNATSTPQTINVNYTLTQIMQHSNATSCWTTINGGVYDLTSWVNQHPGGSSPILSICGKDGSNAFNAQHDSQGRPASILAGFKIGNLAK